MQNKLCIGILSWKEHKTLRNTLNSYKLAGLLTYPAQIFIFFNEIDDEDRKIATEYGIECFGAETNLGIAGAYEKMLEQVKQPHFLFLENDWGIRYEEIPNVVSRLDDGQKFLWLSDVIRYRSRWTPGDPLWTAQFKDNELSRPEHLLDCIHWTKDPDTKFPKQITKIAPGWYSVSAKNANWTNNPHLVRTEWVREKILSHLGHRDIETDMQKWWQTTSYTVVQGEGLFIHNRAIMLRGTVEIAVFGKDNLSDTLRRTNDFFEGNILDYIRDHYPVHKVIVDAGASFGNHTLYFANYLKYDSIYSFEPLPETFRLLQLNATYPNVHIFQNALSYQRETLGMNVNRVNNGASRIHSNGEIRVQAVTIDSFNLKDVTLMKIDVEDSEEYVIKGARETINRCHPLVMVEDYRKRPWDKLLPGYILEMGWPKQNTFLYRWENHT